MADLLGGSETKRRLRAYHSAGEILRGAVSSGVLPRKRKVQWHLGITSQYKGGALRSFRLRTHIVFSEDGKTALPGNRVHRMRRSFTRGWRNARWRDMFLTFLFWLSDRESLIRLPLHLEGDLTVEVPTLIFASPVDMSEGEEEHVDEDETIEEEDESEFDDED